MAASYEVEQKFLVPDTGPLEAQLQQLGASSHGEVEQVDRYFAHPLRDFAVTDEALRIRSSGNSQYVTYKGPKIDVTTKTRHEIEVPLGSGPKPAEQMAEVLTLLGFKPVAVVRKRRRLFQLRQGEHDIEISLDDVEGVGQYAELELQAEPAELEAKRAALLALAARLGLSQSERRSYLELLLTASRKQV